MKKNVSENEELINEFLIESFENLSNISEDLTKYEQDSTDTELLNSIYRNVHTVKGSASFLGYKKLQSLAHLSENILDKIRESEITISESVTDVLLLAFDSCMEVLKSIESSGEEGSNDYIEVVEKLKRVESGTFEDTCFSVKKGKALRDSIIGDGYKIVLEDKTTVKKVAKVKAKAKVKKIKLEESREEVSVLNIKVNKESAKLIKDNVSSLEVPISKKNTNTNKTQDKQMSKNEISQVKEGDSLSNSKNIADSVVRVNVQLLDKIMNVVGELVLSRNQMMQYASTANSAELSRLAQQINMITSDLQNDVMTTRMQPVGAVLGKFERIVRDLARGQKKKIKLKIIGKDTELDKSLLETIRDPMTHMIRNSVDHGVETPEVRVANGKVEEGNITISAYHESGHVIIEIADDGKGIDPEIIAEKAVSKGVITQEQSEKMSERQILNLVFAPGFSTAEKVTNISGRGVGMDVVKSNVDKIGGTVDLSSVVGEGSRFKMKIPLTLAIVPALIIESCGEVFSIPQINLTELVQLDSNNSEQVIEELHGAEFFRLREELIPIIRLNKLLALEKHTEKENTVDNVASGSTNIVVLNVDSNSYGLVVDTILDTEEIVVKPLSKKIKSLSKFAGATIMGDGRVALILDIAGIYTEVKSDIATDGQMMSDDIDVVIDVDSHEMVMVTLGDDRVYGIPLCLVRRLEEFPINRIEWSADQALVQYDNESLPLISIEGITSLQGKSTLEKMSDDSVTFVPSVVVNIKGRGYGFVVKDIMDISTTTNTICSDTVDRAGLLGTLVIGDKTITVIDVHGVVEKHDVGSNIVNSHVIKSKACVLLVEDSPLYRKVTSEFLIDSGFEVITAINGKDAIEMLVDEVKHIDLIVSDIEMPVMNGYEMVSAIRKMEKFESIPIVAVSTRVNDKTKARGEEAGFTAQLEKLNREEVLGNINHLLGLS